MAARGNRRGIGSLSAAYLAAKPFRKARAAKRGRAAFRHTAGIGKAQAAARAVVVPVVGYSATRPVSRPWDVRPSPVVASVYMPPAGLLALSLLGGVLHGRR